MDDKPNCLLRLTGEQALWILLGLIALAVRLAALDAAPLTGGEAREAMMAWRAASGQGMPLSNYSPALLPANSVLFTLFGPSDAVARVLPALFGTCLVVTPLLFRRHMGRVGALAAGAFLAVSPSAMVASRQLGGTILAAFGSVVFLGGVFQFAESESPGWLTFAALGLALGVTTDPTTYGMLLPLGLAYTILSRLHAGAHLPVSAAQGVSRFKRDAPRVLLVFGVAVLALATGLGWNLPGFGASGGLLGAWLGRFRPRSSPSASPLTLLAVYELSVVVFGIGGLIWGVQQRKPFNYLLGLWAALEVVQLMVMPGRAPTDALWAVVPLAFLAGSLVDWILSQYPSPDGALRAAHLSIVLVLWGYGYLMLARYASFGDRGDLALSLTTLVLQGLVGLGFGLMLGGPSTWRTVAGGTALALLAFTLRAGWGVAYRRSTDPREVLLTGPTATNVRDLVETLEEISWQETGVPRQLTFTFQAPQDSVLAWYLKDFAGARRVTELGDAGGVEIGSVVVTYGRGESVAAGLEGAYAGQDFPLERHWRVEDLGCRFWQEGCNTATEWLLFRDGIPLPEADQWATLWRAVDESPTQ